MRTDPEQRAIPTAAGPGTMWQYDLAIESRGPFGPAHGARARAVLVFALVWVIAGLATGVIAFDRTGEPQELATDVDALVAPVIDAASTAVPAIEATTPWPDLADQLTLRAVLYGPPSVVNIDGKIVREGHRFDRDGVQVMVASVAPKSVKLTAEPSDVEVLLEMGGMIAK